MVPARWRKLTVIIVLVGGLAASAAWVLAPPDRWTTPIRQAERALDAGDLPVAGMLLRRVIRDDPSQPRARLLYARFLRLSGRPRGADAALSKARELGAPEADLWREYGLLVAGAEFPKAEGILLRALESHPGDIEVIRALADGVSRQRRWAEAADFYSRWLKLEPDRPEALTSRSRALVQARKTREAVAELRAVLSRHPNDYSMRLLLANCFLNDARTTEAAPELERCRLLRPDRPEPLVGLAVCAIESDDPRRAGEFLDRAVAVDPSSVLALTSRGNLSLKARQYDRALADFEHVVALDPNNKQAHLHLSRLFRRAGDLASAGEHEQAFRDLDREQADEFRAVRGLR